MKASILVLFFAFPFYSFCQQIEGIGFLKLGKTTISIIDSLKNSGYSYKESSDFMDKYRRSSKSILKSIQPKGKLGYDAPSIPQHLKFNVDVLEIANIELKGIELDFYNDTLYSLQMDNPSQEFSEALDIKYGKPTIESKKKTITCTGRLSGSYDLEEVSYSSYYRKDFIKCYKFLEVYYNDKCEKKYLSFFAAFVERVTQIVDQKEARARKDFEENAASEKKKTLIDF